LRRLERLQRRDFAPATISTYLRGSVQIRWGTGFVSHGITAKHGTSEMSGTTVNVVEPI
jgi:hypothetical protein